MKKILFTFSMIEPKMGLRMELNQKIEPTVGDFICVSFNDFHTIPKGFKNHYAEFKVIKREFYLMTAVGEDMRIDVELVNLPETLRDIKNQARYVKMKAKISTK